jgi:hypothetical protein
VVSAYGEVAAFESVPPVIYRPHRPAVIAVQAVLLTLATLVGVGWNVARLHHVHLRCEQGGARNQIRNQHEFEPVSALLKIA